MSDSPDWKERAERRRRTMTVTKATLSDAPSHDDSPTGLEAMELAGWLTRAAWELSGQGWPSSDRSQIQARFVPRSSRDS